MKPPSPRTKLTKATKTEIPVGRIAGPFGVRGELKCDPSSAGRIVFEDGVSLLCERGDETLTVRITGVRSHKDRFLIRIEGVADADAAEAYRGAILYAPREAIDLGTGEYLDVDLVGCAVVGVDGTAYGNVERIEHYRSSDMLLVAGHLVPMVAAIVQSIDMTARTIVIDPPAGLFE